MTFAALSQTQALTAPGLPAPAFVDTSIKVVARGTDAPNETIIARLSDEAIATRLSDAAVVFILR
ncbi:MAG: hypothetical protein ACOX9C_03235 [Kiritimatiellia bacterium]